MAIVSAYNYFKMADEKGHRYLNDVEVYNDGCWQRVFEKRDNEMEYLGCENMNPRLKEEAWLKALDAFINSDAYELYEKTYGVCIELLFASKAYKEYIKAFNEYDTRDECDKDNELEHSPSYIKWMYEKYKEPMQMLEVIPQDEEETIR